MNKLDAFKYIIKEFNEFKFPKIISRELKIPETKKIIALIGVRRSGKTFYFYQLINALLKKGVQKNRILYVNFEDDRILPLKINELNYLLEAYYELYPENKDKEKYFFFDEIHNVEGWELFVRRLYDKENVRIYVTGSSSKLLSKEIATCLRGRHLAYYLFPLSFKEFLKFKNVILEKNYEYSHTRYKIKQLLNEYLNYGGFPEVVYSEKLKQDVLLNYYEMLIYRDLIERYSIRNIVLLKQLSKFLITNISSIFSINAYYKLLKKEIKISKETIIEYLSYLTDMNLVHFVKLFDYSLRVQQVNPKKVYCIDNGLRNAVAFRFSEDAGKLAENIVFIELMRRGYEVYYWKNKREVDFVVKEGHKITAINVCYSNTINEREIEGLYEFNEMHKSRIKELLILTKDIEKEEGIVKYVPLWKWLLKNPQNI